MGKPRFTVTTKSNGETIGRFMNPIDDPFINTTVVVKGWDLFKALLKGKLQISVLVGADSTMIREVMNAIQSAPDHIQREMPGAYVATHDATFGGGLEEYDGWTNDRQERA